MALGRGDGGTGDRTADGAADGGLAIHGRCELWESWASRASSSRPFNWPSLNGQVGPKNSHELASKLSRISWPIATRYQLAQQCHLQTPCLRVSVSHRSFATLCGAVCVPTTPTPQSRPCQILFDIEEPKSGRHSRLAAPVPSETGTGADGIRSVGRGSLQQAPRKKEGSCLFEKQKQTQGEGIQKH